MEKRQQRDQMKEQLKLMREEEEKKREVLAKKEQQDEDEREAKAQLREQQAKSQKAQKEKAEQDLFKKFKTNVVLTTTFTDEQIEQRVLDQLQQHRLVDLFELAYSLAMAPSDLTKVISTLQS